MTTKQAKALFSSVVPAVVGALSLLFLYNWDSLLWEKFLEALETPIPFACAGGLFLSLLISERKGVQIIGWFVLIAFAVAYIVTKMPNQPGWGSLARLILMLLTATLIIVSSVAVFEAIAGSISKKKSPGKLTDVFK